MKVINQLALVHPYHQSSVVKYLSRMGKGGCLTYYHLEWRMINDDLKHFKNLQILVRVL